MDDAREQGFKAGSSPEGWAGHCPFGFDEPVERAAWLKGFGEGRAVCPPIHYVDSDEPRDTPYELWVSRPLDR